MVKIGRSIDKVGLKKFYYPIHMNLIKIFFLWFFIVQSSIAQNETPVSLKNLQGIWKLTYNAETGIDSTFEMYRIIKNDTMVTILNDDTYQKPILIYSVVGFISSNQKPTNKKDLLNEGSTFCIINYPKDIDSLGNIKKITSSSWITLNENEKEATAPDYLNFYIKSTPESFVKNNSLPEKLIKKLKKHNQWKMIHRYLK
jgi:hypothetical protein